MVAGALSAVFSNDVVCLAMTPVVARLCLQRGLNPLPFLIGLACAANIGSAATLIGNPQNMLIGSVMQLHFADYLRQALPPVACSLLLLWLWLAWGPGSQRRGASTPRRAVRGPGRRGAGLRRLPDRQGPDAWPLALLLIFLFTDWPRDVAALVGAGVLLLSRRLHSAHVMGFVDWQLLLLFIGLFVVNQAFESTGLAAEAVAWLAGRGVHLNEPGPLLVVGVLLSNLVSNVPAVMLLLPHLQGDAGRRDAGAGQHLRRQPAAGGLDRQPDRRRPGAQERHRHRLEAACADRHPGDAGHAGAGLGLAGLSAPLSCAAPMAEPPVSLNDAQMQAVHHLSGPSLVLAGAGSGKTRVIVHKIARLLQSGIEPKHIAAITFTNKAAAEMRERAKALVGARAAKDLAISTFHSLGVRMLRSDGEKVGLKPQFSILDSDDVLGVLRDAGGCSDNALARRWQWTISLWKNQGLDCGRRRGRRGQRRRARGRARDAGLRAAPGGLPGGGLR